MADIAYCISPPVYEKVKQLGLLEQEFAQHQPDRRVVVGTNLPKPLQEYDKEVPKKDKNELSAGFWYADTVQDNFTAAQNSVYSARLKLTAKSKSFDFIKKINIPLLEQVSPLAPYTDFTIMLRKSYPAFCLVGPASTEAKASYEVNITKCVLNIRRLHLHDDLVKRHQTLLNSGKKIPLSDTTSRLEGSSNTQLNYYLYFGYNVQLCPTIHCALLHQVCCWGS
jgi:hypothetical protein